MLKHRFITMRLLKADESLEGIVEVHGVVADWLFERVCLSASAPGLTG